MRVGEILTRSAAIELSARSGALPSSTLSTSDPQPTPFGIALKLEHTADAIDFERAGGPDGLPLMVNHSNGAPLPVGRVRNVRIEDGERLRGDLAISNATEMSRDVQALIAEGVLRDVSIGFELTRAPELVEPEDGEPYLLARAWRPLEASVLGSGRDPKTGVFRSITGGMDMDPTPTPTPTPTPPAPPQVVPELTPLQIREAEIDGAVKAIVEGMPELAARAKSLGTLLKLDRGVGSEDIAARFLELAGGQDEPLGHHVAPGADGADKFAEGAEKAILIRSNQLKDPDEIASNEFTSYTLLELARVAATRSGLDVRGLGRSDLVRRVMTRAVGGAPANDTTTYPLILENVLGKAVFNGFDAHPSTWQTWCSTGRADDYKEISRAGLSQFQDLALIAEGDPYVEGTFSEKAEKGQVGKYGRKYSISLEAIVNDDLGAFNSKGPAMGEAAARLVNSLPYAGLVGNPAMDEAGRATLFVAASNSGTDAFSEAAINIVRVGMIKQTDIGGVRIKPRLRYLIGPPDLTETAEKTLRPIALPDGAGAMEHNTVAGRYTWVEEADLTDANDWYGAAESGKTCEMIFLDGVQRPTIEREQGFDIDALHLKVRIACFALFLDWRGLWRNVVV